MERARFFATLELGRSLRVAGFPKERWGAMLWCFYRGFTKAWNATK